MDPARWRRIEQLYHAALARPAAERAALLAQACAGDEALRQEVQALLDAPATADGVFAAPALAVAVPRMDEGGRGPRQRSPARTGPGVWAPGVSG